ncbi:hypothetical protein [Microbispora bryophytorum]|uniref:hypothetical protein n=1 Tax=Microbispora bryophytorum TaxID=1460882 RepID=UPI0033D8F5DF
MNDTTPPARVKCPRCGETSGLITRGDAAGSIVTACCEALIAELNDDAPVLIEDGTLRCPYADCGATDQIFELDVATRDNQLSIDPEQPGQIKASLGDHQFESDGYQCGQCLRSVTLPDDYEVIHC